MRRRTYLMAGIATLTGLSGCGSPGPGVNETGSPGDGVDIGTGTEPTGTGTGTESSASIEFQNQASPGDTVMVGSVDLGDGGYVAIHDARLLTGEVVDSVIGVSEFLESGSQENVEITLFDVEGGDFQESNLQQDQPLVAMPHRETSGNENYDFVTSGGEKDGPYTRAGNAVVDAGFVTVDSEMTGTPQNQDGETSSLAFQNQESTGKTVIVESVRVPEGGFVAIHDGRLFQGQVIESVIGVSEYLESGNHENLEITLFDVQGAEFQETELGQTQPLVAMPHLDTNGNQEYNFVESSGSEDGPYTQNGMAVVDLGFVAVN